MPKPSFQPFGIVKVVDKATPILQAPIPAPDIPTNEIFEGGTGGAVVDHLFSSDISVLGVSPHYDPLG